MVVVLRNSWKAGEGEPLVRLSTSQVHKEMFFYKVGVHGVGAGLEVGRGRVGRGGTGWGGVGWGGVVWDAEGRVG